MRTAMLLFVTYAAFCTLPLAAQADSRKIMNEDRVRDLIKDKFSSGRLEFVERRDDDSLTVYEYFLMRNDTLQRVVVDARGGEVDTILVEVQQGRAILQARQIALTRAEAAALAKVPGEVIRWKLKKTEGVWLYKFRIVTAQGKFKDVFVDKDSFEVKNVRAHEEETAQN